MKKVVFIKNAAILTASSLVLRFVGILFKVWLAAEIGAEGMGLYQLVFSFYMLASTFATSGISTAVTRLLADETALGSLNGVNKIFRRCIFITFIIAFGSTLLIFLGAEPISLFILGDIRATRSLKILSFSLLFMGVSSCFRGYFIARRKALPSASSQIFEQIIRIFTVLFFVKKFYARGLEYTCGAVMLGDTVSEIASALLLWILFSADRKNLRSLSGRVAPPYNITKQISHIALPITSGRYLNTALRTLENTLVPRGLEAFGSINALSQFGMIKGMVLPLLFFPSTLLNSLSTLLIPEISEASARGRKGIVREASLRILQITSLISFIFAGIFFTVGGKIGTLVYKSEEVGYLLVLLSPIVPLMYLDSVADGILKGLDQQTFCFRTGILDSLLRIGLILIFLRNYGMMGFIVIMYFSNFFTCFLNIRRLIKICGIKVDIIYNFLLPISSSLSITFFVKTVFKFFDFSNLVYIILFCFITIPLYVIFLFLLKCVSVEDVADIFPIRR